MSSGSVDSVLDRGRSSDPSALAWKADWIRFETLRLIEQAGIGHYSSTLSSADVLAVLYYHTLRLNPSTPSWPDRDRFLLGKGHIATGLWPILADLGYFPKDWLDDFGKLGSPIADHPHMLSAPGIDFSSGSLGHNLSVAVGMAIAARLQQRDSRVVVLTGDGELHEGQVWEAAMAASHYQLQSVVAIVDANGYCASGITSDVMSIEPLAKRFGAFGWNVVEVDGHDIPALMSVLDSLPQPGRGAPTCLVARTVKGKGVSIMEENPERWHFGILDADQHRQSIAEIQARLEAP